jgi:hypothetical protein
MISRIADRDGKNNPYATLILTVTVVDERVAGLIVKGK